MKNMSQIYDDINNRMYQSTKNNISEGTVMDFYTVAVSEFGEGVYKEIEDNLNPHIYSKLKGESLDDLGFFHDMPREVGESDSQYLYRLMSWKLSAEKGNETAINNALLNTVHSSYVTFLPKTNGSGTGTVYVIPLSYDQEVVDEAIREAMSIVSGIASPAIHIDYVTPRVVPVILHLSLMSQMGDIESIKQRITESVKSYINNIPPKMNMIVGYINKLGVEESLVDYFNVLQIFVDGVEEDENYIYQDLSNKFILDEIIWS